MSLFTAIMDFIISPIRAYPIYSIVSFVGGLALGLGLYNAYYKDEHKPTESGCLTVFFWLTMAPLAVVLLSPVWGFVVGFVYSFQTLGNFFDNFRGFLICFIASGESGIVGVFVFGILVNPVMRLTNLILDFLGMKCFFGLHDWREEYDSPESCDRVLVCSRCSKKGEILSMQSHDWGEWEYQTPSSCHQIRKCRRCGSEEKSGERHEWGGWKYASPSSCLEIQTCSRCGEKRPGHTEHRQRERKWGWDKKVFVQVCQRCGDIVIDRERNDLLAALRNLDTCESAAITLSSIGIPAVEPLIVALKDERERIRQLATWALGKIRDPKAVEPIIDVFGNDKSAWVRLACYSALKQLSNASISENDTKTLVELVATEIRRLYSITIDDGYWVTEKQIEQVWVDTVDRRKYGSYWPDPYYEEQEREVKEFVKTGQHTEPDINSIRRLIAEIPLELRDQVQALSGMSKDLFRSWSD